MFLFVLCVLRLMIKKRGADIHIVYTMCAYVYAYVAILKRSCLLLCLKCVWKVLFPFPFSLKFTYKHIKFLSLILVFHSSFPPLFFAFLFFSFFFFFVMLLRIRFWFIVLVSCLSFFPRSFVKFRLLKCFAKRDTKEQPIKFYNVVTIVTSRNDVELNIKGTY